MRCSGLMVIGSTIMPDFRALDHVDLGGLLLGWREVACARCRCRRAAPCRSPPGVLRHGVHGGGHQRHVAGRSPGVRLGAELETSRGQDLGAFSGHEEDVVERQPLAESANAHGSPHVADAARSLPAPQRRRARSTARSGLAAEFRRRSGWNPGLPRAHRRPRSGAGVSRQGGGDRLAHDAPRAVHMPRATRRRSSRSDARCEHVHHRAPHCAAR